MSNPSQETAQKPVFLDLRNISKSFGAIEALKGINMQLYAGEVVGVDGRQWCGKINSNQNLVRELSAHEWQFVFGGTPSTIQSASRCKNSWNRGWFIRI